MTYVDTAVLEAWRADEERLQEYATELEATANGGGQFFAPRNSAGFAAALRRVLARLAPPSGDAASGDDAMEAAWFAYRERIRTLPERPIMAEAYAAWKAAWEARASAPGDIGRARSLTFARFQAANAARCPEAFHHPLGGWTLLEWAGAMAGEAGEVANVAKKMRRKDLGVGGKWAALDPDARELLDELASEIGDVLSYLSLLASAAGLRLGECAARKFDAVSEMVGWNGDRLLGAAGGAPDVAP